MEILIWIGAAISLTGLAGIIGCVVAVARAKRAQLEDEVMRAKLQKVVAWNLGSLFVSAIGLMMVIVGIFLG
ncbi:hypothetical protein [Aliiruegeria lutimaris]|uniref:Uncharacterized protein n=1 Tax=Aliiruegeria lutimaris TaxID=571298 RepID=A0A1G8WP54_9RHOB|nr:hypothetical protein [Aliiruegeria lutimaris]SDJ79876.1 hypothetical protein SAMN04488026_102448 [Aliiruegeria lutimaris]